MLEISRNEIYRYLGYGTREAGGDVKELVESCVEELNRYASPREIHRVYPLRLSEDGWIEGGCFAARSLDLSKNLKDCQEILVFAATLGTEADHLLQRYNRLQMSRAVTLQAAAAAMIEDYCNQLNHSWKEAYAAKNLYLRPRFSPGYGDFSLENQRSITASLETAKRIGLTLTDSLLMAPSKSVTAVIGISRIPGDCAGAGREKRGCEGCDKTDCMYRCQTVG